MTISKSITQRKRPQFEILKPDYYKWYFLDGGASEFGVGNYISYRQFIVHALWSYHRNKNKTFEEIKLLFIKFKNACLDTHVQPFNEAGFLQLSFCIHNPENSSADEREYDIVLQDETQEKGCYPIFIKNPKRGYGFMFGLDDIEKKLQPIFDTIKDEPEWTQNLEEKLNQIYDLGQTRSN